ncbi:hypothetical protein DTL42_08520 [Bremerella cremea]|uniref:Uncharacterized protein n=1 Tax=Bremerella cremea TaxID=1031537 RepID=A0A368KTJ2_9BACT|nr:hypothetical protein [Bremerella cremea]RCS52863.1 hypothetical protein DTL42_08520 [Bremerella cremea]
MSLTRAGWVRMLKWFGLAVLTFTLVVLGVRVIYKYQEAHAMLTKLNDERAELQAEVQRQKSETEAQRQQLLAYLRAGLPIKTDSGFWSMFDEQQQHEAIAILCQQIDHVDPQVQVLALERIGDLALNLRRYPSFGADEQHEVMMFLAARLNDEQPETLLWYRIQNVLNNLMVRSHPSANKLREMVKKESDPLSWVALCVLLRLYPEQDISPELIEVIRSGEKTLDQVKEEIRFRSSDERARNLIWEIEKQLKEEGQLEELNQL